MTNTENVTTVHRQARDEMSGLSLTFLLGMGVNLIGLPSETNGSANTTTTILLGLHILIGLGLVLGAVFAFVKARKTTFKSHALIGLISIALTFIAGAMTVSTKSNWWSYAMSVGFISDLWIYGTLFMKTRATSAKNL